MSDNATQIRALIENWADAVHCGDLDAVLADHSDDIVMRRATAGRRRTSDRRLPRDLATVLHLAAAGCIVLPRDRKIVAYCRGQYRVLAHNAVRLLNSHGLTAATGRRRRPGVADRRHPRAGRRRLTLPLPAATTLNWGLSPLLPNSLPGQRQRVKKILLIVNGPPTALTRHSTHYGSPSP